MNNSVSSPAVSPTSKNKPFPLSRIILLLAFAGLTGYFFVYFFKGSFTAASMWYRLALFIEMLGAMLLSLAIHEVGHVLAGLGVGFEFRMISVGPFMLQKEDKKIRFRWNTQLNVAGGLALCLPKNEKNLRTNFIKFIAGGPLASLFFALLSFCIYYFFYKHSSAFIMRNFWLFSCLMSGLTFVTTALPMHSKGFFSDGARIFNLLKGGDNATIDLLILTTTIASSSGIRPRDLNMEPVLKILNTNPSHPFIPYLHIYMYAHLTDQKKPDEAFPYLLKAFEGIDDVPVGYQPILWLDLAFHKAYYHQNIIEAQEAFQQVKVGPITPPHMVHKAEAAILWAEGDYEDALDKAHSALFALSQSMDKGSIIAEEEWIKEFIHKLP